MVSKGRLKMALAAEKGTDFKKLNQKKKAKEAAKKKAAKVVVEEKPTESEEEEKEEEEEEDDAEGEEDEEMGNGVNLDAIDDSDTSESSIEMEKRLPRKPKKDQKTQAAEAKPNADDDEDDEEEEEEDEEDIPMSDLEDLSDAEKEDLIPHSRLTINNTSALLTSLKRIAIPSDKSVPFATHQTVTSTTLASEAIPDVSDDLQRELGFYTQSLEAVRQARTKLRAEKVPFSRPKDYFAEMLKEDAHMEKIKAKLVEEASNKKAAAEARKQRDLKKFGKQVQVAKLQERQKAKRETLEKIKTLKRKRQETGGAGLGTNEADLFDVGVDNELAKYDSRSGSGRGNMGGRNGGNQKRQKKDEKYGFGGKKRHAKSGDAVSSSDLSGFNPKAMKAKGKVGKSRPGKGRRKAMASR
ncbi:unnamed protein product [Clonostachys chloroleuca]|uniref:rRNA-processing protein EBP2 n=1 Tax=Clonostachys chloroleuca TaxID=1926264 RepID=A0AA35VTK8_9HYPO|nr:unnamed protein product [Clonostachys chloroleuca]